MTTPGKFITWLATFAVCAAPAVHAAVLSGSYTTEFDDTPNLWDISGSYSQSLDGLEVDFTVSQDPSGKLTGQGTASAQDYLGYDMSLYMDFTLSGSLKSSGNVVRMTLTLKMSGSGEVEGYDCNFTATATENAEIDPDNRQMLGTTSGRVTAIVPSLGKRASVSLPRSEVQSTLPDDVTGQWDLTLDAAANRNKYTGTATIALASGMTLPFTLTGTYTPKTDLSKLTFKGQGANRSSSLSLSAYCPSLDMAIKSLSGKVMGQTLRFTAPR